MDKMVAWAATGEAGVESWKVVPAVEKIHWYIVVVE